MHQPSYSFKKQWEIISFLEDGDSKNSFIGFDGFCGSGKTTISNWVALALDIPIVHLDDYLVKKQGAFQSALDINRLSQLYFKKPFIFDGICLLSVLDALHINLDLFIYCKKYTGNNKNNDYCQFEDNEDARYWLQHDADHANQPLDREVLIYHQTCGAR